MRMRVRRTIHKACMSASLEKDGADVDSDTKHSSMCWCSALARLLLGRAGSVQVTGIGHTMMLPQTHPSTVKLRALYLSCTAWRSLYWGVKPAQGARGCSHSSHCDNGYHASREWEAEWASTAFPSCTQQQHPITLTTERGCGLTALGCQVHHEANIAFVLVKLGHVAVNALHLCIA